LRVVVGVADVLAPRDGASLVIDLLHRDMGHQPVGHGALPVVLARLEEHAVAWPELLDRATSFLDPAAQEFYVDWERSAKDLVAHLRSEAGHNPYDRELSDLVGELSTRSDAFRTWWVAHNVRYHQIGTKRLRHAVVGELDLSYEVFNLAADSNLTLAAYAADPGSRSEEALNLLASWASTPQTVVG
jgi:hypothetical protein